jgi:hypothetical protein
MSTKTTFKRVALVAVAALGLGVLTSVAPANAAASTGFSVNTSSITVVAGGTAAASVTNGAIFKITMANAAADAQSIQSGETLTATVVAGPAVDTNATALTTSTLLNARMALTNVIPASADNGTTYASHSTTASWTTVSTGTCGAGVFTSACTAVNDNAKTSTTDVSSYFLRVLPLTDYTIGSGTYTIRLRLTNNAGALLVQDKEVKVTFVNGAVNSGAIITASASGAFPVITAHSTYSAGKYIKATITDANGGQLVSETTAGTSTAPSLTVDMLDKDSTLISGATGFTALDDSTSADHGYTTTLATGYTQANTDVSIAFNGVYGITGTTASFPTAQIGSTNLVRARYGASSGTGAITIINGATGTVSGQSVSATGASVLTAAAVTPWTLAYTQYVPLTATSATATWSGGTPGSAYSVTVTWAGASSAGDVTPKSATPQVIYADASGKISVPVTAVSPLDGSTATASVVGLGGTPGNIVISWVKSKTAAVSVSLNGAGVALKSANTFTATASDHFGTPVVGAILQPAVTGSNVDATTRATVVTDAKGQASITLTDALAVAAGTDTVKFTDVATTIAGSSVVTYSATAPVTTTLTAFYTASGSTVTGASINSPVPTTGIYADAATTKFAVKIARDTTKANAIADTTVTTLVANNDQLAIRIVGTAAGVGVAASASTGAYILNSSNIQVSSRTQYTAATTFDKTFLVGSNTAGANTITFKSGDVTTTVSFWTGTTAANARFVTLTGAATGAANGDAIPFTAKVTDRYGNAISGATLTIAATGVGVMLGGSTIQSYTTDSTGTFTFQGTSLAANGGTGTFTVTATNTADYTSTAGKVGSSSVDSTLAAGNSSAKVDVVFAAGNSVTSDAAQAAADAAAEATDAANAATDAANAAAEAADAATAAAQDAADAVAALSTQVSEMVNALKKQITALTNLVIKIQKKVKA